MIRRVTNGFEATLVTIQLKHDAAIAKIRTLVNNLNLRGTEHLTII